MKQVIFISFILISMQNSKIIEFEVEDLSKEYCGILEYSFSIKGKCKYCNATDVLILDLETSNKEKIKAECYPVQAYLVYILSCYIDITAYPLNNVSIILPTKAPQTENYNFTNWEKIIGAEPGKTNVFEEIKCLPEAKNIFIPSNITIKDCDKYGRHPFTINGNWEDKPSVDLLTDYHKANIVLDNNNKDVINCHYRNKPIRFDCTFEGEAPLKFKEQYIKILHQLFKIKAFDSGKILSKCEVKVDKSDKDDDDDNDDYWDNFVGSAVISHLNKILIVIGFILF